MRIASDTDAGTELEMRARATAATRPAPVIVALLLAGLCPALLAAPASAAPTWLAPTTLAEPKVSGAASLRPDVAMDARGDALAVWQEPREGVSAITSTIVSEFRPAGGSWGARVDVSAASEDALAPHVAINARGEAVVVWERFSETETTRTETVEAAVGTNGAWRQPIPLSGEGILVADPTVAVDQEGDAVAAWAIAGGTDVVQASFRPARGSWQTASTLSSEANQPENGGLTAGMDATGDALVAWNESVGAGKNSVESAFKPIGGAWRPPVRASGEGETLDEPAMAMSTNGEAIVAWRNYTAGDVIQAAHSSGGGTWQAPKVLSGAEADSEDPDVAMDAHGDAVAIWCWECGGGKTPVIQSASRTVGQEWRSPVTLSESEPSPTNQLVMDSQGDALAIWALYKSGTRVFQVAAKPASSDVWQTPRDVSAAVEYWEGGLGLAIDAQGDGLAIWEPGTSFNFETSEPKLEVAGYDAAGPLLEDLSIPTTGTAGQPLSFSVSPLDTWSALGASSWSFGDGGSASGVAVTHAYTAPGSYTVSLTSADALGNATSSSAAITIAPAPPAGATTQPPGPAVAPALTRLRQSHARWREGPRLAHAGARHPRHRRSAPVGTTFSFSLNERATVSLLFTTRMGGRRSGHRCVAESHRNRKRRRCRRTVTAGRLSLGGHAGTNRIAFQGRLSRTRRLKPGRCTLTMIAKDAAGHSSAPKRLHFTIVK